MEKDEVVLAGDGSVKLRGVHPWEKSGKTARGTPMHLRGKPRDRDLHKHSSAEYDLLDPHIGARVRLLCADSCGNFTLLAQLAMVSSKQHNDSR